MIERCVVELWRREGPFGRGGIIARGRERVFYIGEIRGCDRGGFRYGADRGRVLNDRPVGVLAVEPVEALVSYNVLPLIHVAFIGRRRGRLKRYT